MMFFSSNLNFGVEYVQQKWVQGSIGKIHPVMSGLSLENVISCMNENEWDRIARMVVGARFCPGLCWEYPLCSASEKLAGDIHGLKILNIIAVSFKPVIYS